MSKSLRESAAHLEALRAPRAIVAIAASALALAALACGDGTTAATTESGAIVDRAAGAPGTHRQYGTPVKLGEGQARAYVVTDAKSGRAVEVGVAMTERAMDGLRGPDPENHHGHGDMDMLLLAMPRTNGTPFEFIELDWNPQGHGFPYAAPHFDFHFYTIPVAERDAIDPANPAYAAQAANFPAAERIRPGFVSSHLLMNGTPAEAAVPRMGLHWIALASPELPPTLAPFTATYIVGTWDGKVIFEEPMITRAFIMEQRTNGKGSTDFAVPAAPDAGRAQPTGYRVSWDAQAKEYRVALTGFTR